MKILIIQTTLSGIYYHRQFVPHFYWQESGDEFKDDSVVIVESVHFDKLMEIVNNIHFDIVLYSIAITNPPQMPNFIEYMKRRGSKIVLDIDDRYMYRKDVKRSLPIADSVICVSDYLASHYFQYGAKRYPYVIENGIYGGGIPEEEQPDPNLWSQYRQFELFPVANDEPVFGYLGSTRHEQDLLSMKYDFNTRKLFVVCEEYLSLLNVDAYSTLKHWGEYAWEYNAVDVTLAPLIESKFNYSKSILKVIESGMKKKPIICTDIEPYARLDKEKWSAGVDFMPVGESWKKRVESYTIEEAKERGEALYELVQEYEIRKLNKKRREIYEEIIGDSSYRSPVLKSKQAPKKKRGSNYTKPKKRKKRK
jgi:hypothetical protein